MKKSRQHSDGGARRVEGVCALITLAALAAILGASARSIVLAQGRTEAGAQPASAAQKNDNAPAGNAKNGKAVYTTTGCYECHGREAQGGAGTGPKLGPSPIPYTAFAFQVRSPRDQMPPYTSKVLSDSDLVDIYAFVQAAPQPPKVDSNPLLK